MKYEQREDYYTSLLGTVKVRDSWASTINSKAQTIARNRERYEEVSRLTNGVPWEFIAVVHNLECGGSFEKHLHNGDSLRARTVRVPRGYPKVGNPPFTWEESAIDALKIKGLHKITDWSQERICYELERFNGFGYVSRNINSPYLWSGTNHYDKGKYVADHVFDRNATSKQIGAVPLFFALRGSQYAVLPFVTPASAKYTTKEVVVNSSKLTMLKRIRLFFATTFASVFTVDTLNLASDWMSRVKQFATENSFPLAAGGIVLFILVTKMIESKSVEDANEGRYTPSGIKSEDI